MLMIPVGENYKQQSVWTKEALKVWVNDKIGADSCERFDELEKLIRKADTIYWCFCPYSREINNSYHIMWDECEETLDSRSYDAAQEI